VATDAATHVGGPIPAAERPPAVLSVGKSAFFLDLDGTLLRFAPRPDAVSVDAGLRELLESLRLRSRGALALVSGRSIASLDSLLAPLTLPAAGLHGFERRDAAGTLTRYQPPDRRLLDDARRQMEQWVRAHPRLMLEDKGCALALHYRRVPKLGPEVVNGVIAIGARVRGSGLAVQRGHMVVELTPTGVNKGSAVAAFMSEAPFAGRQPLYAGDDLTDESAFEWVNAAGGVSVAVNCSRPTAARTRLDSVDEVRAWLRALLEAGD
jgi:trehalose 6-phosphate phosphatase